MAGVSAAALVAVDSEGRSGTARHCTEQSVVEFVCDIWAGDDAAAFERISGEMT